MKIGESAIKYRNCECVYIYVERERLGEVGGKKGRGGKEENREKERKR